MLEFRGATKKKSRREREMNSHLVDEVVFLQDVEHDRPDDGHLQDPHEDLHQEPGDPRS